ncbi:DUF5990 family protein [Knoellia locipacati]|uniref:DUF5990 family protein n=1 Tax=Knoellia locipacati TaxID=882824 RepID=UPI00384C50D9
MDVRIVGSPLPPPVLGGQAVLVGLQRGRTVDSPRAVSGTSMTFEAALDVVLTPAGVDLRGPWVQGPRGDRFLYLCWGHAGSDGFEMARQAKLMLGVLDPADLMDAPDDATLTGRLSLVDARGGPVCAAVRPPAIRWSLDWSSGRSDRGT